MTIQVFSVVTLTVLDAKTKEELFINGTKTFEVIPQPVLGAPVPLTITRTRTVFDIIAMFVALPF